MVYGLTNVQVYFGDCMKIYNWASDVLYVDPPWGGPNYRNLESVELFLGSTRIDVWLEDILSDPLKERVGVLDQGPYLSPSLKYTQKWLDADKLFRQFGWFELNLILLDDRVCP